MKQTRIVVTHYGGPDALQVVEEDCPEPKRGEVRVRVLAAGVSLPDLMMREGIHPETPPVPFTPGWDLIGVVERLGDGIVGFEPGQIVAALPITGSYAEFVCLPHGELVPVPSGLDPAEAVSLVLNYVTAYQMLHRSAKVTRGQRVLIHGAAGGVGSALLQLGRLVGLEMYGTCSSRGAPTVSELGGVPIDYRQADFVSEIRRLTGEGVDAVFDGIGGAHIWRSRTALRRGGRVVAYGLTSSLRGGRLASGRSGRRRRFRAVAIFGLYIAGGWLLPGRRRVVPYSIQWFKRLKPALFRDDLSGLFVLLRQQKLKPLIAQRIPLTAARQAQELLGKEGVTGKIVLVPNGGLEARIRAYAAAWAARDRDAWLRTFAADATQEDPVGDPVRRGQREIGDFWDREMARYKSIEIVPREIFVIGHEAAMVWTINGVTEAGAVSFGGVDVFRFDDAGLISSVRAFWERDSLHSQFQRLRDAKSSGR